MQIAPLRTQTKTPAASRRLPWGTLLPALAAGLAAAGFAFVLVRSRLPAIAAPPPSAAVVVAARDIPARTRLTAGLLHTQLMAADSVPDGALGTLSQAIGKISMQPILSGEAVTRKVIAAPSAALGLAFALPPSLRAVTVATDPADGVDLFVRPQDHVDVLATDEPGHGPAQARTVLQNVLLLAVGSRTSPDPPPDSAAGPSGGVSHITVAVSPAQAQALVLAAARGPLHLALRAIGDGSVSAALPVLKVSPAPPVRPTVRRRLPVLRAEPPVLPALRLPKAVPPPPAHLTVTIIKGGFSQAVPVAP